MTVEAKEQDAGLDINDLVKEIKELRALLRVQSHKTLLIHRALATSGILGPAEFGSPTAEAAAEVRYRAGSSNVIIGFGSKGQGIFSSEPEMSGTLTKVGTDCLFYRDFQQAWWSRGLMGLTADIPSTAEYLRRRVADLGYKRAVTTGVSMGGYAAILFGVLIGAERIIAFGPQTRIDRNVFTRFAGTDAKEVKYNFKSQYADLARLFEETPFSGRVDIYYSTRSGFDEKHAKYLEHVPQVSLHALDSDDHNSAAILKEQGLLTGLYRFDEPPPKGGC